MKRALLVPLLACSLVACQPDPTDDTVKCRDFLKFSTTEQTQLASYQLMIAQDEYGGELDTPANEADVAATVANLCKESPNDNAQDLAHQFVSIYAETR